MMPSYWAISISYIRYCDRWRTLGILLSLIPKPDRAYNISHVAADPFTGSEGRTLASPLP